MLSPRNFYFKLLSGLLVIVSLGFASEISFKQIPNCTYQACFPYHSSAIGCTSLSTECFCNAIEPINCAAKSCTGSDWYALEDWFDAQCGQPPVVDFGPLSLCSRACVRGNIMPAYCNTTITRNCFCRLQPEIESFSPCIQNGCNVTADEAVHEITKFYNDTCIRLPSIDGSRTPTSSGSQQAGDEVFDAPSSNDTSNTPESRLNEIIGLASGLGTLVGFVLSFFCWLRRKRRRSNRPGRPALDDLINPPPQYTPY